MGYIVAKVSGISRVRILARLGKSLFFTTDRSSLFITNHTSVQASFALTLLG